MTTALRPLSTGELLDRTFSLYRSHFGLFVGLFALPHLVVLAFQCVGRAATFRPSAGKYLRKATVDLWSDVPHVDRGSDIASGDCGCRFGGAPGQAGQCKGFVLEIEGTGSERLTGLSL
jgi:hypothetical protein